MNPIQKAIDGYSKFVSTHLTLMIVIVVAITLVASYYSSTITTEHMEYRSMLPEDVDTINALFTIEDNFGGTETAMIAIEIDPSYAGSSESRDIRDPEVLEYIDKLTQLSKTIDDVESVSSATTIMREANNGNLLKSQAEIDNFISSNPQLSQYISSDYQMALIKLKLRDDFDFKMILKDIQDTISQVPKKEGLTISPAGQALTIAAVSNEIGPDIAKTSQVSMIGIILILLLLFRSIVFGLTPLSTIIVGVVWAFGYLGLMGFGINSLTSGTISMIMGVGIDFGIQIVNRYKEELQNTDDEEKAMEATLSNVIAPMGTTTIATLIGFTAMSFGQLSVMKELGNILSYGITTCFFAAITIVPVLLILFVKIMNKHKKKERREKL